MVRDNSQELTIRVIKSKDDRKIEKVISQKSMNCWWRVVVCLFEKYLDVLWGNRFGIGLWGLWGWVGPCGMDLRLGGGPNNVKHYAEQEHMFRHGLWEFISISRVMCTSSSFALNAHTTFIIFTRSVHNTRIQPHVVFPPHEIPFLDYCIFQTSDSSFLFFPFWHFSQIQTPDRILL